MEKIKVLVVDDAAFMRKAVKEILEADPQIEVVGTAENGQDALTKIPDLWPDVITLDIDMPIMDGLTTIRNLMIRYQVPVVVLSSMFGDGAITFEALRLGVVDFIPKPSGAVSADIDRSRSQIIDRVKLAHSVKVENIRRVCVQLVSEKVQTHVQPEYLVTIGTSLGGPNTVIRLLTGLNPELPAALIAVKQIAPGILPEFVKRFNEFVPWEIRVAEDGVALKTGTCYIGSNEESYSIETDDHGVPFIRRGPKIDAPLNLLFSSAAEVFDHKAIGVLLTGIGDDGAEGLAATRESSGVTIAQESNCCIYPNLTDNAIQQGAVDIIRTEKEIGVTIEDVIGV